MKNQTNLINIFKFFSALLVVSIHTRLFEDVNSTLSLVFTKVISDIAIPFFLIVSGYFYIKSLNTSKKFPLAYLKKILIIYSLWSLIYIPYQLIFVNYNLSIFEKIKFVLSNYFIYGSMYHFWYFPALVICILTTWGFAKINKLNIAAIASIVIYIIGVLGCSYYSIGSKIPFLNILYSSSQFTHIRRIFFMSLPFFLIGYFINKYFEKLVKLKDALWKIGIVILFLFAFEMILVFSLNLQINVIITFMLYPLGTVIFVICLLFNIQMYKETDMFFRKTSNITYYSHPLIIILITTLGNIIGFKVSPTILFVLTCGFLIIFSAVYFKISLRINKQ
ncbi:MAG: acyltransferase [Bacillota bacterium]